MNWDQVPIVVKGNKGGLINAITNLPISVCVKYATTCIYCGNKHYKGIPKNCQSHKSIKDFR